MNSLWIADDVPFTKQIVHLYKRQAGLYPLPLPPSRIQRPCPSLDGLSVKSCYILETAVLQYQSVTLG